MKTVNPKISNTYVDNVNFNAVNADVLKMRVKTFVKLIRHVRRDESDSGIDDLINGEILHRQLKPRRELWSDNSRRRKSRSSGTKTSPVTAKRVPDVDVINGGEFIFQISDESFHPDFVFAFGRDVVSELEVLLKFQKPVEPD